MKREDFANAADKIFSDIDSEVAAAAVLGGIAAYGGLTPPLTRILMAMGSSTSIRDDYSALLPGGSLNPIGLGPGLIGIINWIVGQGSTSEPVDPKTYALVASGALEGMITMSLVKNPGTMQLLGDLIAKVPV